ncbi:MULTISPECIES: HNH endonuclease [unclassified Acinetobacter]|uniref:HNH endonuclease n=1 Tax=unclassified Acinetobacter TaxID=196816 RepID=UPI0035B7BE8B
MTKPSKANWGNGRGGRPWRRIKQAVHERDQYTCRHCGIVTRDLECDHIVNMASCGTHDIDNLQSLCKSCHQAKTQVESQA